MGYAAFVKGLGWEVGSGKRVISELCAFELLSRKNIDAHACEASICTCSQVQMHYYNLKLEC